MWMDDLEGSFFQACKWLELCGRNGIIQNPEKFQFAEDIVEFAGFAITLDSIRPCKKFLQAIQDFPTPKNILIFVLGSYLSTKLTIVHQ